MQPSAVARRAACLILWLPLLAGATPVPATTPRYTGTVLAGAGSQAHGINAPGQVVGSLDGNAWLYSGGVCSEIGAGSAYGINDLGQIAGTASGNGFLYSGGTMTTITGWGATTTWGINNAGTVVGMAEYFDEENGVARRAYSYTGGVSTDLGTLYGIPSHANAINNLGHIAGAADVGGPPSWPLTPFLYRDGTMQDLGPFWGPWS